MEEKTWKLCGTSSKNFLILVSLVIEIVAKVGSATAVLKKIRNSKFLWKIAEKKSYWTSNPTMASFFLALLKALLYTAKHSIKRPSLACRALPKPPYASAPTTTRFSCQPLSLPEPIPYPPNNTWPARWIIEPCHHYAGRPQYIGCHSMWFLYTGFIEWKRRQKSLLYRNNTIGALWVLLIIWVY